MSTLESIREKTSIKAQVIDVLRMVIDPELGINIVDMGLLYLAEADEVRMKIRIEMTLSSRGCPMGAAIVGGAENTLTSHFPGYSIAIDLVWEPGWSNEFISAQGRQQLEL